METTTSYAAPVRDGAMSYKEWALTLFLTSIPVVGLILLFVWAFSESENIHKRNFAKGALLLMLIFAILWVLFFVFFGGMAFLGSAFS